MATEKCTRQLPPVPAQCVSGTELQDGCFALAIGDLQLVLTPEELTALKTLLVCHSKKAGG